MHFTRGSLPIRYLGLPLSSKKWSKMECHQLVEKITTKINRTYSRLLSYADRLQIINAVLFSKYNFWGVVLILSRSVLKKLVESVEIICGEILWRKGKRH